MTFKPDFETAGVKLFCADSSTVLPTLGTSDLLLTDPPYCNGYVSNQRVKSDKFQQIVGDVDQQAVLAVLKAAWDNLRVNRHGYVFGNLTPAMALPNEVGGTADLIWDKSAMSGGDLSSPWGKSHEPIWFGSKRYTGDLSKNSGNLAARLRRGTVLRVNRAGETSRIHPMQKPVGLLRQLVEMSSNQGDIVCDPYMGSGSTGVAALLSGRSFVGIEIDRAHFYAACKRIKKAIAFLKQAASL